MLSSTVPHVAIHHTTGPHCITFHSCEIKVQPYQKFHMETKGWDDIGYNFLIGGNGYIFEGRCIDITSNYISARPLKSSLDALGSLIKCGISFGFIPKKLHIH